MIKSYVVESTCNDMRLDRWLRNKLGKIPQGLIEKNLRLGKIKINKKKVIFAHNRKPDDPSVELSNLNNDELPKYVSDNLDKYDDRLDK